MTVEISKGYMALLMKNRPFRGTKIIKKKNYLYHMRHICIYEAMITKWLATRNLFDSNRIICEIKKEE